MPQFNLYLQAPDGEKLAVLNSVSLQVAHSKMRGLTARYLMREQKQGHHVLIERSDYSRRLTVAEPLPSEGDCSACLMWEYYFHIEAVD